MDIAKGFQIEVPDVFVPWGISEPDLRGLLDSYGLRRITRGYYTLSCISLRGMSHKLGFHFYPRSGGSLNELEFFRQSYENQRASFEEFQKHFEDSFGKPTKKQRGGFPSYTWDLKGARIVHYIIDRFGPEEHMRIQKAAIDTKPNNSFNRTLDRMAFIIKRLFGK